MFKSGNWSLRWSVLIETLLPKCQLNSFKWMKTNQSWSISCRRPPCQIADAKVLIGTLKLAVLRWQRQCTIFHLMNKHQHYIHPLDLLGWLFLYTIYSTAQEILSFKPWTLPLHPSPSTQQRLSWLLSSWFTVRHPWRHPSPESEEQNYPEPVERFHRALLVPISRCKKLRHSLQANLG